MRVKKTSTIKKYKITDDGILNSKNKMLGVFKIKPIRLRSFNSDDMKKIHENFTFFLNKIDVKEFQIEVIEEEVNVKKYIDQINDLINTLSFDKTQDKIRRTILEREKLVIMDNVLKKNISKKAYYFIYSDITQKGLEEKRLKIKAQFKSANIEAEELNRKDVIGLCYKYFNPVKYKHRFIPKVYDNDRFNINQFVESDYLQFKTDIKNGIFDYIVADGVYQKILYFASYPDNAFLGWLNSLCDFKECDVSMCFKKSNIFNLKKIYNGRLDELKRAYYKAEKEAEKIELQKEIEAQMQVISKISMVDMAGYNMMATIRTKALSLEKLKENVKTIKEGFEKRNFVLREGFLEQHTLSDTNSPLLNCKYYNSYSKQILSDVLAIGYPFIHDELMDDYLPIFIGKTLINGAVFLSADYEDENRLNYNEFIVGKSGSGKTSYLLLLIWYRFSRGEKQFILDIEGEQLKNMTRYLKGDIVDTSNVSGGCINPLQVRIDFQDDENNIKYENILNKKPLASHMLFLRQFFRIMYKNNDEASDKVKIIELFLYEMYKEYNITNDTTIHDILNMKNNEFPTMKDLYNVANKIKYGSNPKIYNLVPTHLWDKVMLDLYSLSEGAEAEIFNGHTTVDLYNNNLILFDFSGLYGKDKEMFKMQYFNCQTLIWGYIISSQKKQLTRIYKDEGHTFIEDSFAELLEIEKSNSRRVRKYRAGITFATQEIATTLLNEAGYTIFSQSQYRSIFRLDENGFNVLLGMNQYRKDELEYLKNNSQRGECILDTGDGSKIRMKIELQYLKDIFEKFKK